MNPNDITLFLDLSECVFFPFGGHPSSALGIAVSLIRIYFCWGIFEDDTRKCFRLVLVV